MNNWNDVQKFMATGEDLNKIPEGTEVVPVVGVSFIEGYPQNLHRLAETHRNRRTDIWVELRRNPENPYDSNAIEVRYIGEMLGHLSKDVAARIAPILDGRGEYLVSVFQVRISPDNPNNPGLDVLLDRRS